MNRFRLLALLVVGLLGCGGSQSYRLVGTPTAPDADAALEVSAEDGNQVVSLEVAHLMPMERAKEGASTYAVWVTPEDRDPIHLGNLDYDKDKREGKLKGITPHKEFVLTVTAEESKTPEHPEGPVVFKQEVEL